MQTIESLIKDHPFWDGLPEQFIPLVAECATLRTYDAREQVFMKGHTADEFYLILSGHVVLETPFIPGEGVITVQTLGEGEAFGWSWLFFPHQWHFTARSIEPTETIVFDAIRLRELAEKNPLFGYKLALRVADVMMQRLQVTRSRLLTLCEATHQTA
ncbi:MAG TPA: cyclic nucleotide-binding domain-containing protein, partial [Terrimicrobiaceae bacterium]|mgnify:CR=1 FL=1|nr:cyclic nucleotide-binding domain-containing protein [Terrimicrobiaceae bacterium]